MNALHEAIFRKAMVSVNPEAILAVARAFDALMATRHAWQLYQRAYGLGQAIAFGAMARGTRIEGTNGAVIPPGRYWLDVPSGKRAAFDDWKKGKPEVRIETSEDDTDTNMLSIIFTIPAMAANFGLPGVFFPTNVLGFPTIAGANIQSKQDTGTVPDAPTSADVLADITSAIGKALGAAGKGAGEGLGISTTKLVMIGVGTLAGLFMLNRLMMPRLPGLPV